MRTAARIVLVAKPWRGGLAKYVSLALDAKFPGCVSSIATYPATSQEKFAYRLDKRAWRMRLVEKIQSTDADVVVFINILPEFALLPRHKSYVLWLTDSPLPALNYLEPYAHVFLSDPGYVEDVKKVVGATRYAGVLPFACLPDMHKLIDPIDGAKGFCFIANRDNKRDQVLRYLFEHGREVWVYGNYFLRHALFWRYPHLFRPSVDNARMGDIYAHYIASLNIHADVVKAGTNMRTFECASYAVPQVVEYKSGIEDYFNSTDELYIYHDMPELMAIMQQIEDSPDEARKRAQRAHDHALSEHTYQHRIVQLLAALG